VVLVVAIVIGLALLARGGSGDDGDDEADATTTEARGAEDGTTFGGSQSTLAPIDSSTTTPPEGAHSPEEVTAIVLNGISYRVDNAARDNSTKLSDAGYVMLDPATANATLAQTTVYSSAEFADDANAIRGVLGLPDAVLAEKPVDPLGPGAERADVIVVLGDDYAPE
jgi:hypothetical protein